MSDRITWWVTKNSIVGVSELFEKSKAEICLFRFKPRESSLNVKFDS